MAAVLACGPGTLLSHRSAAALHGIRRNPSWIDVTVPGGDRGRKHLRVHSTTLHPDDITQIDHIPVTSISRTLLDLAPSSTLTSSAAQSRKPRRSRSSTSQACKPP